jgi:hypothetical protein
MGAHDTCNRAKRFIFLGHLFVRGGPTTKPSNPSSADVHRDNILQFCS